MAAPVIGAAANQNSAENLPLNLAVSATDVDGDVLTYAIDGGADAADFTVSSNGILSFVTAPNYELPHDSDVNNEYRVRVAVSDGINITRRVFYIVVQNVNESPSIQTTALTANENQTLAGTIVASDPESDTLQYTITGGADAAKFEINVSTGVLTFKSVPNYEQPIDS